jgi:hypothetical protein
LRQNSTMLPGWPWTHKLPASASWVLGLHTTMPSFYFFF